MRRPISSISAFSANRAFSVFFDFMLRLRFFVGFLDAAIRPCDELCQKKSIYMTRSL
jgi:hypothetical protein